MKPLQGSFSIVLLGSWNPAILNPSWVKTYLFSGSEEVEMAYAISNAPLPPRLKAEGVEIYPSSSRIDIRPTEQNIEGMNRVIAAVIALCENLPHTPLSALGINFSFEQSEGEEVNPGVFFETNDSAMFPAERLSISATELKRSFVDRALEAILNYGVSSSHKGLVLSFNIHKELSKADEAKNFLQNKDASHWINNAIEIAAGDVDFEFEGNDE